MQVLPRGYNFHIVRQLRRCGFKQHYIQNFYRYIQRHKIAYMRPDAKINLHELHLDDEFEPLVGQHSKCYIYMV